MIDPIEIIKNGIPVYKAYQRPKEYICTFFKVKFFPRIGLSWWIFSGL